MTDLPQYARPVGNPVPSVPDLHLWTNDSDVVIATSAEDAIKVCEETGMTFTPGDLDWSEFEMIPDNKSFTYREEEGEPSSDRKLTAAEWVKEKGRGYFASYDA
jgi:hypothetical protein